jgi:hypothetical protein
MIFPIASFIPTRSKPYYNHEINNPFFILAPLFPYRLSMDNYEILLKKWTTMR